MNTVSDTCRELLAQSRHYAPLYGNRLANHLPMAVVALDGLGAAAGILRRFADG